MTTPKPPKLRKDGQPKRSGRPSKDAAPTPDRDDDDLLGVAKPVKTKVGAPAKKATVAKPLEVDFSGSGEVDTNVFAGVSVTWLAEVFRMDPTTVKKRLAQCVIKGKRRNAPIYDLLTAAQFLVPPKVDVSAYIQGMRPTDLPPLLQSAYWDAMKKKQDWEIRAKLLWDTDKVIEVFGETFKHIKNTVSLWADTLEQEQSLDERQREALRAMSDSLMSDIHASLVEQSRASHTPNQYAQLAVMEHDAAENAAAKVSDNG